MTSENKPNITEIMLEAEWARQSQMLADLYASALKMSPREYVKSLPKFLPQPDISLPIPLIVETRLDLPDLAHKADIYMSSNFRARSRGYIDWSNDPQGFKTPKMPYTAWVQSGSLLRKEKPTVARSRLLSEQRGGTVYDGVALAIFHPSLTHKHEWDLIGSESTRHSDYKGKYNMPPRLGWKEYPVSWMPFVRKESSLNGPGLLAGDFFPASAALVCSRQIGFQKTV